MSNLNPGGLTRVLNYIKTWVTGLLNDKANSAHSHDDRYYTETEVDTKLNTKANDNAVVHTSGNETITGNKYFNGNYVDVNGYRFRIKGTTQEIGVIPTDRNAWNGFSFVDKNGNSTFTIENGHLVNGNTMLNFSFTRNLTDSTLFNYESVRLIKDEDDAQKLLKCGVYPTDNNKFPIGSSSSKWADVYATTLHGELDGNSSTATTLETARRLWGNSFDGSQNLSGNIEFTNNDLTGVVVGVKGKIGSNDYWRVGGGATATNAGFLEIASADDNNEPIYVRQYKGAFTTVNRTATLLDANGNTQFPGTVTAPTFTGNLTGDCSGTAGSVAWANVSDKPTIPTKTSELTNDSGFLTAHQSLSNYSTLANTVKSLSISGKTITVTPGSGSAYTLTTQDTVYTHPTTAGNKHIPSGGSANQYLKYSASGTAVWANLPTIPSKTSQLTNDSDFITSSGSCNYANYSGYVQGDKSTGLYVESVKYGNALVTTNQSGFGAIFNAPTKNYRIGCATYPNNDDTLLFYSVTNANVSSSTNTVNKSMIWDGGTGILMATGFSGPLTGNVTGNCSGSSGSCTGNAANVTGTVAIGHGGTGATTRLGAVQNLTNENVGTSTEYFLTITTNWGKAGYCSVANAKSVLGVPTNTNQLTNGAGFITSSGSCNYANSAGKADYLGDIGSTDRNSASGTGWYSVGFSYSYDEGHGELAINNYWGIRLNCRDSAHVSINGSRINVENATYLNGYRVYVG